MSSLFKLLVILISFLLISQTEGCAKRFQEIKRKIEGTFASPTTTRATPTLAFGLPPTLYEEPPPPTIPKYAKKTVSNFYVEVEEDDSGSYRVINTDLLPPILDQKLNLSDVNLESLDFTLAYAEENSNDTATAEEAENGTNSSDYNYDDKGDPSLEPYLLALPLALAADNSSIVVINNTATTTTTTTTTTTPTTATNETEAGGVGGGGGAVEEEEEILSEEDNQVRLEWGGDCLLVDWTKCNKITRLYAPYYLPNDPKKSRLLWWEIDCLIEPTICMRNDWTVNRCHIVCMSKCNKEMLQSWDKIVSYEGPCRY